MNSLADSLYYIKYNPFKYSEFLASFYFELDGVSNNLLLTHLVIPLCCHPFFSRKLSNANSKSTIWTIFDDRREFYDLQERFDSFKDLTSQSLQYCLVNDWLELNMDKLTVNPVISRKMPFIKQKSAANLGKLFSNLSIVEIYAFLGVMPE